MTSTVETSHRAVKVVLAIVFFAYDYVRRGLLRLVGRRVTPPFVVLMYHSVKRHERARFAHQMDRVASIANTVYADFDAKDIQRPHVAVTFDDAYYSILENAWPVLQERSIPATLFAPTQYLGGAPGWITDPAHRNAGERLITADELRGMATGGALIGSHSVTHRRFAELNSAQTSAELSESRKDLEEILGRKVLLFACPYGSSNAAVVPLAARAGYKRVFFNIPIRTRTGRTEVIGRVEVSPTDWRLEYALKIRGAYQWLPAAIAAKRRVLSVVRAVVRIGRRTATDSVSRAGSESRLERRALLRR